MIKRVDGGEGNALDQNGISSIEAIRFMERQEEGKIILCERKRVSHSDFPMVALLRVVRRRELVQTHESIKTYEQYDNKKKLVVVRRCGERGDDTNQIIFG
jgi:hypothetical protein